MAGLRVVGAARTVRIVARAARARFVAGLGAVIIAVRPRTWVDRGGGAHPSKTGVHAVAIDSIVTGRPAGILRRATVRILVARLRAVVVGVTDVAHAWVACARARPASARIYDRTEKAIVASGAIGKRPAGAVRRRPSGNAAGLAIGDAPCTGSVAADAIGTEAAHAFRAITAGFAVGEQEQQEVGGAAVDLHAVPARGTHDGQAALDRTGHPKIIRRCSVGRP